MMKNNRDPDSTSPPPERGAIPRHIPRGLEVLVKKAAVDPAFKKLLFEKRAEAAKAIGLKLNAAEEAMLAAVPLPQLEGIIAYTRVAPKLRPAFLGYAAGAMLAALSGMLLISDTVRREPDASAANDTHGKKPVSPDRHSRSKPPRSPNDKYGHGCLGMSAGISPGEFSKRKRKKELVSVSYPSAIGGTAATDADRAPTAIAAVIQRHVPGIENVYNSALKKNPNLGSGKITLRFTVAGTGEVNSAEIIQDTLGAPGLADTVLSEVRTWRFPPAGGGDVTVIYPFRFNPGGI